MAEVRYQGRVVETRGNILVLVVPGRPGELTFRVRLNDAEPGDFVWLYSDGQVEVKARADPNETIPVALAKAGVAPEQDHS